MRRRTRCCRAAIPARVPGRAGRRWSTANCSRPWAFGGCCVTKSMTAPSSTCKKQLPSTGLLRGRRFACKIVLRASGGSLGPRKPLQEATAARNGASLCSSNLLSQRKSFSTSILPKANRYGQPRRENFRLTASCCRARCWQGELAWRFKSLDGDSAGPALRRGALPRGPVPPVITARRNS